MGKIYTMTTAARRALQCSTREGGGALRNILIVGEKVWWLQMPAGAALKARGTGMRVQGTNGPESESPS